ncbi:type II toxin-antitoxin system RelE/ParE family toxin [Anabaena cylindrica FACHB-243]|uniref:Plasmid stabilization system n=1 Tax=Anabaena cylindrica (strain ATCC 27899 / PCC 7122) TaxID=272123 RepID=K9ZLX9_ANACC|nr:MULTISPECIES: type II toxin-antitoxin system RelE/ParE family toxin [Anabaena]AFZ60186.1 plasmid stabilization system [Anabaena cylindrica PCC 7122]MBD2417761.1 type II toxin-antitoxin system RelE/ParE family toxin [Anabaena cylindrica FACHB-243]MBY5282609.1 type II toxin-antitoxin system RelE/ParE family toxin [Anabaena sp. CCAP 1446/1C]MBY5310501.1 type II toxin-antitoxin system RelE/ParE family toxin [Anabaena sp. CCAP 1446/1C]MCM2404676.1 type II toxin-antitoxin system RelE/ParE family 
MTYHVQIAPATVEQITKLDSELQQQVVMKLEELALNPLLAEAQKLKSQENLYVIRLGKYRIVYQLQNELGQVMVLKVA